MPSDWQIICGDAKKELAVLADASVNLTVTSPPYFRHRDYGVKGQIGMDDTIDKYLSHFRVIFTELLRVTDPAGTCFFVVGDTYRNQKLLLVPHRLAILADEVGWIVRNDIIWNKLDPPPESPQNRWRSAHEHVLFLAKARSKYKFDSKAVRIPYSPATIKRWGNGQTYGGAKSRDRERPKDSRMRHGKTFKLNPSGCLPTDVWSLPSGDSSARHYATFPENLIRPIIEACSKPGDLVLDPFAGTGTTCRAAASLGRRSIGIELNPKYVQIARQEMTSLKLEKNG